MFKIICSFTSKGRGFSTTSTACFLSFFFLPFFAGFSDNSWTSSSIIISSAGSSLGFFLSLMNSLIFSTSVFSGFFTLARTGFPQIIQNLSSFLRGFPQ